MRTPQRSHAKQQSITTTSLELSLKVMTPCSDWSRKWPWASGLRNPDCLVVGAVNANNLSGLYYLLQKCSTSVSKTGFRNFQISPRSSEKA